VAWVSGPVGLLVLLVIVLPTILPCISAILAAYSSSG